MRNRKIAAATVAGTLFALPAAMASAHVTLQPKTAVAGGFARLDVRVPNERDDARTTKVSVRFPAGFLFASYEPEPGWRVTVLKRKLATPAEAHGEQITEEVDRVVFTARDGNGIAPGEFRDFGLSLGIPERAAGTKLTFKALQTYSGGEVVRWIGPPDADEPAPQVELTAEAAAGGKPAAAAGGGGAQAEEDEEGTDTLAIIALIAGGLGLIAGTAALLAARRARST
jgi:uncharacterized protein